MTAASSPTVLSFLAKPKHMGYGGNDNYLIQLLNCWPDAADHLVLMVNKGHPCRDLFTQRISPRVRQIVLDEELMEERRQLILEQSHGSASRQRLREFLFDIARPFLAVFAILRLRRQIRALKPRAAIINIGGNPPEDLGWRFLVASWLARVPRVIVVNHIYPGHQTTFLRGIVLAVLRKVTRFFCDLVVTPSKDCGAVVGQSMGMSGEPICIYYGIEPQAPPGATVDAKRHTLQVAPGPLIGMVANMEERKGLLYLIRATAVIARTIPTIQVALIGKPLDQVYLKRLRDEIKTLKLDEHVRIHEFLPDAAQYFECFDIGVVPSIQSESFGIVAIEAMRYGKPVVAARTGGLPEVVRDGETGLIVPARDAEALAQAILSLLNDSRRRETMGQAGRKRFESLFTNRRMAEQYHALTLTDLPIDREQAR